MNLHSCPACGLFGRKARRRERGAEDRRLVEFHRQLAAEVRDSRKRKLMMAAYTENSLLLPWQRDMLQAALKLQGGRRPVAVVAHMPPQRGTAVAGNYIIQTGAGMAAMYDHDGNLITAGVDPTREDN